MENRQPKLRFPEFSGEWEKKKLGAIATITTGSTPSTLISEYYNGNKLFVSPADLQGNRYVYSTKTKLTELGFSKGRKIDKGSVVFVCIGSTIGKVGITTEDSLTNQQINSLKAKTDYSNNFIYSLLELNGQKIKLLAGVQAVPQINKTAFSNLLFHFPNISEQTKIANFLIEVDKKLTALKQKKSLLEQYKKGVMQKIFSQELRFKEDNGNDYPDWEEKKLGEVCEIAKSGGTPTSTKKEYYNGDIPFLSISDMTLQGKYLNFTSNHISELGLENSSSWLVPINSIIYSMYASVGFVAINRIPLATSQAVLNLILKKKLNLEFMYYTLVDFQKNIAQFITTGTQGNLNANSVKGFLIQIPSLTEQTKIANFLSAIDEKINHCQKQIEKTQVWKKGLLQQMFV
ncbi:restriction endonuclease subunit S [Flavobacterium sp. TAB 87]|uniref:restriction endonuclease subunit S n=1 Tax=Flavobacterium sp. TAB 87 TaxID=1729581 RepID=UPI00076C99DF|nr:restriction endonuclease subunit S [Flavobacterium sp. TAB 87]KVV16421.1 EcoKI restriction-modification system protein HsdS [Flavobacterium sp. TAB 87]